MSSLRPIPASRTHLTWPVSQFRFETTETVRPLDGVVHQDRAVDAIRFALDVPHPQFNLFVAGPPGAGKSTLVQRMAARAAARRDNPPDRCFVHNFDDADRPLAIALPAGRGRRFASLMRRFVENLHRNLPAALSAREYRSKSQSILEDALDARRVHFDRLRTRATKVGIGIEDDGDGLQLVPLLDDGSRMSPEQYDALDEPARKLIEDAERSLRDHILDYLDHARTIQDAADEELEELDRRTVRRVVAPALQRIRTRLGDDEVVARWLDRVAEDVVEHLDAIVPPLTAELPFERPPSVAFGTERYEVNVIVDHDRTKGGPVVVEYNPTFTNLVGRIDRRNSFGAVETNHTLIRAGALLRANGGVLVLNARVLLESPWSWHALKRALREGCCVIEEPDELKQGGGGVTLRPEPIPLSVRVILIGTLDDYLLLREVDDEFARLFKVRADFEETAPLIRRTATLVSRFASSRVRELGLRHVTRDGICALIELGSREAGRRDEVTLSLSVLTDVIVEADQQALAADSPVIDRAHIEGADVARQLRDGMFREQSLREFRRGHVLVQLDGERVGQVNGLSVVGIGDTRFGVPFRITAKTFAGSSGVVNIERESELSGQIHSKAVLILQGYLGATYAREQPLAVSASITFEQNYHYIEGDSASVAETVALLSSLAEAPCRQDLAITGSMSQHGEIQPIGGVTEKIEGWFDVCDQAGLTGSQGVIIPWHNVDELHLAPRVVSAIEAGTFAVYAAKHIDEVIALMTGLRAGSLRDDGTWAPSSIHGRAAARLATMVERADRN